MDYSENYKPPNGSLDHLSPVEQFRAINIFAQEYYGAIDWNRAKREWLKRRIRELGVTG